MTLSSETASVTLDICLRSAVTGVVEARQNEVLDRIQQLRRNGVIDDTTVRYWSGRVNAPEDGAQNDSGCPDVVEELYEVTANSDTSLEPFFREKKISHESRAVLFLPVVCLLVRKDGDPVGVFPATSNGTHQSVQDGLDALANGDGWTNLS